MRTAKALSTKKLNAQFKRDLEPTSTQESARMAENFLDAVYEKANLPEIIEKHSNTSWFDNVVNY